MRVYLECSAPTKLRCPLVAGEKGKTAEEI